MSFVSQTTIPEDELCAICGETLKDPTKAVYSLDCNYLGKGHFFHVNCLVGYCDVLMNEAIEHEDEEPTFKCPTCREEFLANDICSDISAFTTKGFDPESIRSLPTDVQVLYNQQVEPEQPQQNAGKRKKNRKTKKQKKTTRKSKKSMKKSRKTARRSRKSRK